MAADGTTLSRRRSGVQEPGREEQRLIAVKRRQTLSSLVVLNRRRLIQIIQGFTGPGTRSHSGVVQDGQTDWLAGSSARPIQ